MKKFILMAAVLIVSVVASAKTWRINPNAAAKPDFTSLTAACEAQKVNKGDTLYCEPGLYINQNENKVTKDRLTLLGPGFSHKGNVGSTSAVAEANFSARFTIDADTINIAGLKIAELYIYGIYSTLRKDITIERCYIGRLYNGTSYFSNITIRDNYFSAAYGKTTYAPIDFSNSYQLQNINIENNIIIADYYGIWLNAGNNTSALIAHNTVVSRTDRGYPVIKAQHTTVRDNIFINTYPSVGDSYLFELSDMQTGQFYNNVLSLNPENTDPAVVAAYSATNSFVSATVANTFTCQKVGEAEETYYQLKEGSVAKNKAYQGEDCGAFAGTFPFVVCGRPQGLPYIYDVYAPNTPTDDKLTITFKVKANNE